MYPVIEVWEVLVGGRYRQKMVGKKSLIKIDVSQYFFNAHLHFSFTLPIDRSSFFWGTPNGGRRGTVWPLDTFSYSFKEIQFAFLVAHFLPIFFFHAIFKKNMVIIFVSLFFFLPIFRLALVGKGLWFLWVSRNRGQSFAFVKECAFFSAVGQ